ncbi:MAG: glycosyltransferase [Patescibacteria group bacterium]|nr:glycosyltransferase [Patescibacteria group bacterium]
MNNVSVVLITYNRVNFLKKYVGIIFNLLDKEDEFIIVDNNSKDDTQDFLKNLKYDNLKIVSVYKQGLNICRNIAIKIAKFNYVIFIDDDAYPDDNWIKAFKDGINETNNIAIYAGKTINDYETIHPNYLSKKFNYLFGEKNYGDRGIFLKRDQSPGGGNMMLDKYRILDIGGFDEFFDRRGTLLLSNGETELVNKIFSSHQKILYVPRAIIYHWVGLDRLQKKWIIKRMFWQGISDGFLAKKNKNFIFFLMKRVLSLLIKVPIENLLYSKNINMFIFSIFLEITKTIGIIKSITIKIEDVK